MREALQGHVGHATEPHWNNCDRQDTGTWAVTQNIYEEKAPTRQEPSG